MGHFGVGKAGDLPAQADHRGFVGQAGAGGWLVECRDQDLVFEDVGVAAIASDWLQFFGDFEHTGKTHCVRIL